MESSPSRIWFDPQQDKASVNTFKKDINRSKNATVGHSENYHSKQKQNKKFDSVAIHTDKAKKSSSPVFL